MALFISTNLVGLLQSQADVVEAIQQTVFAESINIEWIGNATVAGAYDLFFQINDSQEKP